MFPGLGGLNPKKMQAMMKQLGMKQEEISASRVIIEKTNGSKITVENPSVSKISMQGQESFQVSGEAKEENAEPEITQEDIKTIMEKANVSEKEAKKALEESKGDLAEAILNLKG